MPVDPVLARELKSLHEEISALRRERVTRSPDTPSTRKPKAARGTGPEAPDDPEEAADDHQWQAQLRAFVDETTRFFEEAEKNVSAHPAASMLGALVVGIMIGRQIGRR